MNQKKGNHLPWVEKYRPSSLDDIVGHTSLKKAFRYYINSGHMPNLLLSGVPGVGKTAIIHSFAHELYEDRYFNTNFVEYNSSDDRTIKVVRERIKQDTQYPAKGPYKYKIIYLGEIDGMIHAAQDALKRTMEVSYRTARFMADCNNPEELIPAIQSRFCHFHVIPPTHDQIILHLKHIAEAEGVDQFLNDEIYQYIVETVRGDMRNAISLMEGLPFEKSLTCDVVRGLYPSPDHELVAELIRTNWNKDHGAAVRDRERLLKTLFRQDVSGRRILEIMFEGFQNITPLKHKWRYLAVAAEYEIRVQQGNPQHQLRCCLEQIREIAGLS